jgi:hypothetical protein
MIGIAELGYELPSKFRVGAMMNCPYPKFFEKYNSALINPIISPLHILL